MLQTGSVTDVRYLRQKLLEKTRARAYNLSLCDLFRRRNSFYKQKIMNDLESEEQGVM